MFVLLFSLLFVPTVTFPPTPDPAFTDADGDGYIKLIETRWGCDPNDPESFPYCIEWDTSTVATCEPVSQLIPLVPCDLRDL